MLFPTVAFALFFCIAFLANWLLRPRPIAWRVTMIALSLFFYGYWDARFVVLLAGSIVINWAVAAGIASKGRWLLWLGVAANLGVLGFFKYYGFFVSSVLNGLSRLGIEGQPPLLSVVLPIGISFFTFQAISYLIDLSRGHIDEPLPFSSLAFYLSFFPQLVAGPIVRATVMAPQIDQRPDPRTIPAGEAFWLIGQGLVKKVVISSYLGSQLVDPVFDVPGDHSAFDVMLAVYGYTVQIYADFSGYTDIAIGCALLLGFRFPANFDSPFRSCSVREFWHRWHISLSTWLRDYLYVPLGGNRGGRLLTGRNLAITMVLGGLWHGAAWTFVAWGAIHAIALIVERAVSSVWRPIGLPPTLVTAFRWLITFHVVGFAWIFFRADSIGHALELLGRLSAGGTLTTTVSSLSLVVVAAAIGIQFWPTLVDRLRTEFAGANAFAQIAVLAIALTAVDALGPEGIDPFIYFQF